MLAAIKGQLPEQDLNAHANLFSRVDSGLDSANAPRELLELRISFKTSRPECIDEEAEGIST